MARKSSSISILGILLLMFGILAGVILVKQTQDIRNKAKEITQESFFVCHTQGGSWENIEVNEEELKVHLDHGDIYGTCPIQR